MNGPTGTIGLTCHACGKNTVSPVTAVLVAQQEDGTLTVRFPCEGCLSGVRRIAHPSERALALAAGCGIQRGGETSWPALPLVGSTPVRPDAYPRPGLLARLARRISRLRNRGEQ